MSGTLILHFMTVRSSFIKNAEVPADGHAEVDTEQWWIGPESSFKIHTFALDRDIRIFEVKTVEGVERIAQEITEKHYGDIVDRKVVLRFDNCLDEAAVRSVFESAGLEASFDLKDGAFLFWHLPGCDYKTISEPDGTGQVEG